MKRETAWAALVVILLAGFFLRQYRLLDFPYHGDEVDEGDIALEILSGHLAPFYPQNEGNEALYHFALAPFFAILGDSVIANRFPSAAWSTGLIALMYAYGRALFRSRRIGVMAAALAAALWWSTVFGRLGLREISQPVLMIPALIALVRIVRAESKARARQFAISGGIFAGLTAYTFLSGRGFPIIVIVFLAYLAITQRPRLAKSKQPFALYIALTITLSLPLWLYLLTFSAHDYHVRELVARSWIMQGNWHLWTMQLGDTLGMFTLHGDLNWIRNIAGRPVFPGPEGALFYLGVALCVWRWRKPEYALQLIVIGVMLTPNILADNPPRWTRSIGILPGLLVAPALPLEQVWTHIRQIPRAAPRRWIAALYPILVVTLGISIYTRTTLDLFGNWIDHPNVYGITLAFYDGAGKYIHQSSDTTPLNYVMDVYEPWRAHNVERVAARPAVPLRFSLANAFVIPNDPRGARIAFQIFGAPATPLLNTFLDLDHPIFTDPRVESEGRRLLQVYALSGARLAAHLAAARANPVFAPNTTAPLAQPVRAGNVIEFAGYEILNSNARAGETLNGLTYWRVIQRPTEIAIFMHLLDAEGNLVSQFDGFDAVTSYLQPGDLVIQLHAIPLPATLASRYRLQVGVYTRADVRRLPLDTGGDALWLSMWQPP